MHRKLEAEDFVCHWFRTTIWRRTYEEGLTPIRGARFWPTSSAPEVHPAPDPDQPEGKERQKKKGKNESPVKKKPKALKRIMHCGRCGAPNHNSRFHKKAPQAEPSQSFVSQDESSQA
ncbi:hypothetical protein N665_0826s0002 [Sinapis alba]|nr:hypothetical protein N665_0826s0002 [Sinapis alba]